jgi:MOSC domain-containing protein YiiM
MAELAGIWTSPGRGSGSMEGHARRRAVEEVGLEGCAHARPGGRRQVLFASAAHLRAVGVEPGAIRENLTIEGADVQAWPVGQRVAIGDAEFEITMVCDPCERMDQLRPGLRAELEDRRGMLARVVKSGDVSVGDEVRLLV